MEDRGRDVDRRLEYDGFARNLELPLQRKAEPPGDYAVQWGGRRPVGKFSVDELVARAVFRQAHVVIDCECAWLYMQHALKLITRPACVNGSRGADPGTRRAKIRHAGFAAGRHAGRA